MSQTKKRNIIIGSLCAVLLLMVVGYAAFSTMLDIKGTSGISSNWKILITKIDEKNIVGSASTSVDESGKKKISGVGTLTATFETDLVSPGDSIEYDITVTNQGSLDARLDKITLTDSNNPAINFTASGLTEGSILGAGESAVLTVKVEYDNNVTSQPGNTIGTLSVTLDYVQNDGNGGTVTPNSETLYRVGSQTVSAQDSADSITGAIYDYSELGKNHFIKHVVTDNKVESSEVCFIKNEQLHCLKPNNYDEEKSKLLTIFDATECRVSDSSISCTDSGTKMTVVLDSTGNATVMDASFSCQVSYENTSDCMGQF